MSILKSLLKMGSKGTKKVSKKEKEMYEREAAAIKSHKDSSPIKTYKPKKNDLIEKVLSKNKAEAKAEKKAIQQKKFDEAMKKVRGKMKGTTYYNKVKDAMDKEKSGKRIPFPGEDI